MAERGRAVLGVPLLAAVLAAVLTLVPAAPTEAQPERHTEPAYGVDDVRPVVRDGTARQTGIEPFTTIGITGGEGRVRAHLPSGWTRWFPLHVAHGAGSTTDPVWVGEAADGYELRLDPGAEDVVVHLVRPTGEEVEVAPVPPAPGQEAGGNSPPPIRRRSTWGAAPYRGTVRLNARITTGIVHHTVNSNTYSAGQVPGMLRSIQAFHQAQNGRNWPDIAYNFIVDRFGVIWEARARSYDQKVRASATSGTTVNTVTVAFLGDGSSRAAPSSAVRAMGRLLGWKMRKHGTRPTRANIVGHRQVGSTSCPGNALMGQVPAVETAALRGNPPPGPYDDVPWTSRNAKAIDWAGDTGIIPGYGDHTFRPKRKVNRAAALVFLWRLAGQPNGTAHPFTDVPPGAPYEEAVEWGSDEGIIRGISADRYGPGRVQTRRSFVDMLWRWVGSPKVPVDHPFTDAGRRESLDWASLSRLIGGTTLRPTEALTRAIAARWLHHQRPYVDVRRTHVARRAVDWARAHVIATGYGKDHTFRPGQVATRSMAANWVWRLLDRAGSPRDATPGATAITRADAITWLWEAAGSPDRDVPPGYSDVPSGAPYEVAAAWNEDFAIFTDSTEPTFRPGATLTRSDLVRALYRLAGRPAAWAVDLPDTART